MKKIISTALTVIMLLTSIIAVIPMNAFAAESGAADAAIPESTLTMDEVAAYVNKVYLGTSYNTPEEMLEIISTEYPGYLISSSSADRR